MPRSSRVPRDVPAKIMSLSFRILESGDISSDVPVDECQSIDTLLGMENNISSLFGTCRNECMLRCRTHIAHRGDLRVFLDRGISNQTGNNHDEQNGMKRYILHINVNLSQNREGIIDTKKWECWLHSSSKQTCFRSVNNECDIPSYAHGMRRFNNSIMVSPYSATHNAACQPIGTADIFG